MQKIGVKILIFSSKIAGKKNFPYNFFLPSVRINIKYIPYCLNALDILYVINIMLTKPEHNFRAKKG